MRARGGRASEGGHGAAGGAGAQFTGFTSTKVQILTRARGGAAQEQGRVGMVLSFLAFLVQKYKY